MRDFAKLLCAEEPADACGELIGRMTDLISVTHHALCAADATNAERIANAAATSLEILAACASRVDAGVWDLERIANRGHCLPKTAEGAA